MSDEKMWGAEPFWGLGYEWDPDWVLTDRQKELRATLIQLCEQELRDNAKRSDDELLFPRRNLELLQEDGVPAVFDRYSNSFLKIYFKIPPGRENELARKVLVKHLQSGNSYGIQLKEKHTKFPQPELGPWVAGSRMVGADWHAPVLEGWEAPAH